MRMLSENGFSTRLAVMNQNFSDNVRRKYLNAGIYDYAGVSLVFLEPNAEVEQKSQSRETLIFLWQLLLQLNETQIGQFNQTVYKNLQAQYDYHIHLLTSESRSLTNRLSQAWQEAINLRQQELELMGRSRVKTKSKGLQRKKRKLTTSIKKELQLLIKEQESNTRKTEVFKSRQLMKSNDAFMLKNAMVRVKALSSIDFITRTRHAARGQIQPGKWNVIDNKSFISYGPHPKIFYPSNISNLVFLNSQLEPKSYNWQERLLNYHQSPYIQNRVWFSANYLNRFSQSLLGWLDSYVGLPQGNSRKNRSEIRTALKHQNKIQVNGADRNPKMLLKDLQEAERAIIPHIAQVGGGQRLIYIKNLLPGSKKGQMPIFKPEFYASPKIFAGILSNAKYLIDNTIDQSHSYQAKKPSDINTIRYVNSAESDNTLQLWLKIQSRWENRILNQTRSFNTGINSLSLFIGENKSVLNRMLNGFTSSNKFKFNKLLRLSNYSLFRLGEKNADTQYRIYPHINNYHVGTENKAIHNLFKQNQRFQSDSVKKNLESSIKSLRRYFSLNLPSTINTWMANKIQAQLQFYIKAVTEKNYGHLVGQVESYLTNFKAGGIAAEALEKSLYQTRLYDKKWVRETTKLLVDRREDYLTLNSFHNNENSYISNPLLSIWMKGIKNSQAAKENELRSVLLKEIAYRHEIDEINRNNQENYAAYLNENARLWPSALGSRISRTLHKLIKRDIVYAGKWKETLARYGNVQSRILNEGIKNTFVLGEHNNFWLQNSASILLENNMPLFRNLKNKVLSEHIKNNLGHGKHNNFWLQSSASFLLENNLPLVRNLKYKILSEQIENNLGHGKHDNFWLPSSASFLLGNNLPLVRNLKYRIINRGSEVLSNSFNYSSIHNKQDIKNAEMFVSNQPDIFNKIFADFQDNSDAKPRLNYQVLKNLKISPRYMTYRYLSIRNPLTIKDIHQAGRVEKGLKKLTWSAWAERESSAGVLKHYIAEKADKKMKTDENQTAYKKVQSEIKYLSRREINHETELNQQKQTVKNLTEKIENQEKLLKQVIQSRSNIEKNELKTITNELMSRMQKELRLEKQRRGML